MIAGTPIFLPVSDVIFFLLWRIYHCFQSCDLRIVQSIWSNMHKMSPNTGVICNSFLSRKPAYKNSRHPWVATGAPSLRTAVLVSWLHIGRRGLDPRQRKRNFPLASVFRPALRPTQLRMYRRPIPGGKARPGRDAGHSPPCSGQVKKE
jgi:hypothetical protein